MTSDLMPWSEGSAELVGRAILASLWQVSLVALGYWLLGRLVSSPRWRYAAACAALAASVVLPIATLRLVAPREIPTETPAASLVVEGGAATARPVVDPSLAVARRAVWSQRASQVLPWLGHAWAVGVLLLLVRLCGGAVRARFFANEAGPVDRPLEARARALAARLRVRRSPRLRGTTRLDVPCVVGAVRPVILIPFALLSGLSPAQLDALLLHELAHVRRHDYLINLLQSVAEALLFFHPAARWLSRQVRLERELCCDDLVVGAGVRAVDYAGALTKLEGARRPVLAPAAAPTGLLYRVRRILGETPREERGSGSLVAPAVLLGTVLAVAALAQQRAPTGGVPEQEEGARVVQASVWLLEVEKSALSDLEVDWRGRRAGVRFSVGVADDLLAGIERWSSQGRAAVLSAPTIQVIEGERGSVRTSGADDPVHRVLALDLVPTIRGRAIDFLLGFRVGREMSLFGDARRVLWRVAVEPDEVALIWDDVNDSRSQRARLILLTGRAVEGGVRSDRPSEARDRSSGSAIASIASSEPVTLSLSDAPLGDVIDSFAREFGFELDLDEAAERIRSTSLTAELQETPGDVVLDSILWMACLEGEELETGVLRIRAGREPMCAPAEPERPEG